MKKTKMDNYELFENELYEFDFNTFLVCFDGDDWWAESLDPENDEIILIENEDFSFDTESLGLFGGYILTRDHFTKLKETVIKDQKGE